MGKIVRRCECGATSKTRSKVVKGIETRLFVCDNCEEGKYKGGKSYVERYSSHYTRARKE